MSLAMYNKYRKRLSKSRIPLRAFSALPEATKRANHNIYKNRTLGEPIDDDTRQYVRDNLDQFLPSDEEVLSDHNTDGGNRSDSEWEDDTEAIAESAQAEKDHHKKSGRIRYQDHDEDDDGGGNSDGYDSGFEGDDDDNSNRVGNSSASAGLNSRSVTGGDPVREVTRLPGARREGTRFSPAHDDTTLEEVSANIRARREALENANRAIQLNAFGSDSTQATGLSVTVTNQKDLTISSAYDLNFYKIKKFCDRARTLVFSRQVMMFIQPLCWKIIIKLLQGRCKKTPEGLKRSKELAQLLAFVLCTDRTALLDPIVWSKDTVIALLLEAYPEDGKKYDSSTTWIVQASAIRPCFDFDSVDEETRTMAKIFEVMEQFPVNSISVVEQATVVRTWVERWNKPLQTTFKLKTSHNNSVACEGFIDELTQFTAGAREARSHAQSYGWIVTSDPNSCRFLGANKREGGKSYADAARNDDWQVVPGNKKGRNDNDRNAKVHGAKGSGFNPGSHGSNSGSHGSSDTGGDRVTCNHCNRSGHGPDCPFLVGGWHPDVNPNKNVLFIESREGKRSLAGVKKFYFLNPNEDSTGKALTPPSSGPWGKAPKSVSKTSGAGGKPSGTYGTGSGQGGKSFNKGTFVEPFSNLIFIDDLTHLNNRFMNSISDLTHFDDSLLSCTISLYTKVAEGARGGARVSTSPRRTGYSVKALLDQGSLAGDFISSFVYDLMNVNNICDSFNQSSVDGPRLPICSGLDNSCTNVPVQAVKLLISFVSENENKTFSFVTSCRVLPKTPFGLILGRKTIKEFNLALLVPSHFFSEKVAQGIIDTTHPLLLSANPVHGVVSSEKDNRGQAHCGAQPCNGCHSKTCGRQSSDWNGSIHKVREADLRTHAVAQSRSGYRDPS